MSASNVEVARALTELWNEGVRDVPAEYVDPAVELESPFATVSGEDFQRDHRIRRVRIYWQPDEARRALGLSR